MMLSNGKIGAMSAPRETILAITPPLHDNLLRVTYAKSTDRDQRRCPLGRLCLQLPRHQRVSQADGERAEYRKRRRRKLA
jgi:hypothetical protein